MTPYIDDLDFTLYVGDALEILREMPDESVHCVVTSPPYWGLRDYGTGEWDGSDPDCDHVQVKPAPPPERYSPGGAYVFDPGGRLFVDTCGKCGARRVDRQLGLEATPDLYVENMVAVFREVRRVLRRDGTCWLNLGDSYISGQGGRQSEAGELPSTSRFDRPDPKPRPDLPNPPAGWAERAVTRRSYPGADSGWKPKDLAGMPWRVAFALQADGWYLRADVIWSKPNPMPESVSDRPTKAHEYLFLLTRSPRYFYDADAIREPHAVPLHAPGNNKWPNGDRNDGDRMDAIWGNAAGRNRRSVWEIATEAYPDAHFATFPQGLVEPCVKAGTSERGCCPVCGAPWEREVRRASVVDPGRGVSKLREAADHTFHRGQEKRQLGGNYQKQLDENPPVTVSWRPSCGHDLEPVPCTVLDPFMGSGTTALVARRLGRRSIGVELNLEYANLAARRLAQLSLLA